MRPVVGRSNQKNGKFAVEYPLGSFHRFLCSRITDGIRLSHKLQLFLTQPIYGIKTKRFRART